MTPRGHWFLPETPDVVGLLRRQLAITIEGMDAFAAWAGGSRDADRTVRDAEHRADEAKRDVQRALSAAFVLPMEPEDIFALSRGSDSILNHAKDLLRESDVMDCRPDETLAEMASRLSEAVRQIDSAIAGLDADPEQAAVEADAAIKSARRLEKAYRAGMAKLLDIEDVREVMARRELYRRCSQIGDSVVDVAERVIYAVVKEN